MTQQLLLDILPVAPPTLDGFVAGHNRACLQAVRDLAPGRALYLWGGPGSGRSHLLRASTQGRHAPYFTPATDARDIHDAATDESRRFPLVAIDDVGRLSPAGQAALFALYNRWRAAAGTEAAFALLAAGDAAPLSMSLREDLRTRLGWDLVFRLEQLSDQDRAAAMRERALARGLLLGEDILAWILNHHDRDMGRLTALIDALDRYSLQRHRPITLPLLKALLADTRQYSRTP